MGHVQNVYSSMLHAAEEAKVNRQSYSCSIAPYYIQPWYHNKSPKAPPIPSTNIQFLLRQNQYS